LKTRPIIPWLYLFAASVLILFFLVYPTINTLFISFKDSKSIEFIGFKNYLYVFTNDATKLAIRNNLLWMIVFPVITVSLGLLLAVLVDKVRYEKILKSVIFLPMAISFVGAGVVWRFMYAFRPVEVGQIGFLNWIVVTAGGKPLDWLSRGPWINNIALVIIGVWIWTGFCMTVFSAAYKGLSSEILEAGKIDGANEWHLFWKIVVPMLMPTISTVTVTMLVFSLKVFDIIYITTNGLFDTEVLANRMYKELFLYWNLGRASAIATILLVASIAIMSISVFHRSSQVT